MSESSTPVPESIPEPLLSECRARVESGDPVLAVQLIRKTYGLGLADTLNLLESSLGRKLGTRLDLQPDGSVVVSGPSVERLGHNLPKGTGYEAEIRIPPGGFTVPDAPAQPKVEHFGGWFDRDRITFVPGDHEMGEPPRRMIGDFELTHGSLDKAGGFSIGGVVRSSEKVKSGGFLTPEAPAQPSEARFDDTSPPDDITTDTPAPERLLGWLPEGWRVHKQVNHFYGPNGEQVFNHGHGHVVAWGSKHEGVETWTEWTECDKRALVLALAYPARVLDVLQPTPISDALQTVLAHLGLSGRYAEICLRNADAHDPQVVTAIETIREAMSLSASFRRVLDVLPDQIQAVFERMPEAINAVAKLVEEKGGQPVYQDPRVAKLQARVKELEARVQELESGKDEGQA